MQYGHGSGHRLSKGHTQPAILTWLLRESPANGSLVSSIRGEGSNRSVKGSPKCVSSTLWSMLDKQLRFYQRARLNKKRMLDKWA